MELRDGCLPDALSAFVGKVPKVKPWVTLSTPVPVERVRGVGLYYEEEGHGIPVLFLHGAWASARFFEAQIEDFSQDHQAIALDFRGHGRSEPAASGHTVDAYARDVREFLDRLDLDEVVLVGWSLGALVAWSFVEQHGTQNVLGVVNVDMEPAPAPWAKSKHGRYSPQILQRIHQQVQDDHWRIVNDSIDQLLKHPPGDATRRMMFDETTRCPPTVKSSILLDATMQDHRGTLATLDVPMLVCAGADEAWRSVQAVQEAADLAPDARFVLFEESGHCPMLEEPERFNNAVRAFVDEIA